MAEQAEIELIGTGASVGDALELAAKCAAGVITLGLTNLHDNLALIEALNRFRPDLRILVFASRDDHDFVQRAVQLGVRAVVLRDSGLADLMTSITRILKSSSVFGVLDQPEAISPDPRRRR